jgi:3-oxoadipate enol-lactonase
MPTIRANGVNLYYESTGSGPETLVFSHGLLMSGAMFRAQVEHFSRRHRVVVYDHRGQGRSEVTPGGYAMDTLAEDAAALIEGLELAPCHFAGLSMGGFVGLRLAARRPELLRSCILLETSAEPEPPENVGKYRLLSLVARTLGPWAVTSQVLPIMFGETFLADPARAALRAEWTGRMKSLHRSIHLSVGAVVSRPSVVDELASIRVPTLILVGDEDVATPRPKAERLHAGIAGSRLVVLPRAGHSSTIEEPEAVNAALDSFLATLGASTRAG